MALEIIKGNIFTTQCQTLVNTINCVGVMGAGIALECRLRYPSMYSRYVTLCKEDKIDIGLLWLFKNSNKWVLNFPTKKHWKAPSEESFLHAGLQKFVQTYCARGVTSIAFPLLGADRGGIAPSKSLEIMTQYLSPLDIDVEIYEYDPMAQDDIYASTKSWLLSQDATDIAQKTAIRIDYVHKLVAAMQRSDIYQLNQLARVDGVGIKTLEKVFSLASNQSLNKAQQKRLF
jgi:O-acetyl-ADP-ribose deacetylase (regulator of RNase III)